MAMNKTKHQGFTLVEVIFSIALLSIVSVVILNLYIASGQLNNKAQTQNMASLMASNIIEDIKSMPSIPPKSKELFYNEYWELVDDSQNAEYRLYLTTMQSESIKNLIEIEVQVKDVENQAIVTFTTAHFLTSGGEQ
jgi:prepilin-type N-terminal cleavage/methylation domain-containing protein